jgi:hypothetical protein
MTRMLTRRMWSVYVFEIAVKSILRNTLKINWRQTDRIGPANSKHLYELVSKAR